MVYQLGEELKEFVDPGHHNGNHPDAAHLPKGTPAPEGNRRKNISGGLAASSATLVPIDLIADREPWERQPAERLQYYTWFQNYLEQPHEQLERSLKKSYLECKQRAGGTLSTRIFAHAAKVWRWRLRAEAFDEYVFRAGRNAYINTIELMAARQARRGVTVANLGVSILRELAKRIEERGDKITFRDLKGMFRPAMEAVSVGQREERLARGFGRQVLQPEAEDDNIFEQTLSELGAVESTPELEEAFTQLETVLVERVRVTKTVQRTTSHPVQPPARSLEVIEGEVVEVDA